ncbi:Uncharacterised protein [Myroides odoratus]|nr:hypothetical protein Myrod_1021 [Myroides odoratus DSM 2801]EKB09054.1 hypothetical protein HMPREF9716_00422 [Myroides odoratus CIP 103059]STZ29117.1 Uncharacterised protein [Myroides odoratus]
MKKGYSKVSKMKNNFTCIFLQMEKQLYLDAMKQKKSSYQRTTLFSLLIFSDKNDKYV